MRNEKMVATSQSYHRNGVAGNGFSVVKFRYKPTGEPERSMLGIVFEKAGDVAVFDLKLLAEGNISFGENSWRGDDFEKFLRHTVATK